MSQYSGQDPYGQPAQPPAYPHQSYGQPDQDYGQPPPGYGYLPAPPATGFAPTLDQPYYGISLLPAMKRAFVKYARFDGRASRSEYWWFQLGVTLYLLLLGLLFALAATAFGDRTSSDYSAVGAVAQLIGALGALSVFALIVPSLSLLARRLHDGGYSALWLLLYLLPYLGGLVLLVFAILPSTPEGARYDRVAVGPYTRR